MLTPFTLLIVPTAGDCRRCSDMVNLTSEMRRLPAQHPGALNFGS